MPRGLGIWLKGEVGEVMDFKNYTVFMVVLLGWLMTDAVGSTAPRPQTVRQRVGAVGNQISAAAGKVGAQIGAAVGRVKDSANALFARPRSSAGDIVTVWERPIAGQQGQVVVRENGSFGRPDANESPVPDDAGGLGPDMEMPKPPGDGADAPPRAPAAVTAVRQPSYRAFGAGAGDGVGQMPRLRTNDSDQVLLESFTAQRKAFQPSAAEVADQKARLKQDGIFSAYSILPKNDMIKLKDIPNARANLAEERVVLEQQRASLAKMSGGALVGQHLAEITAREQQLSQQEAGLNTAAKIRNFQARVKAAPGKALASVKEAPGKALGYFKESMGTAKQALMPKKASAEKALASTPRKGPSLLNRWMQRVQGVDHVTATEGMEANNEAGKKLPAAKKVPTPPSVPAPKAPPLPPPPPSRLAPVKRLQAAVQQGKVRIYGEQLQIAKDNPWLKTGKGQAQSTAKRQTQQIPVVAAFRTRVRQTVVANTPPNARQPGVRPEQQAVAPQQPAQGGQEQVRGPGQPAQGNRNAELGVAARGQQGDMLPNGQPNGQVDPNAQ